MADDTPQRVHIWRFHRAPVELQELFPEGTSDDWLVQAAEPDLPIIAPSLLGWRRIYPVKTVRLADGSTVLWGAPREAVTLIAQSGRAATDAPPSGIERRTAERVRIECALRYEIYSHRIQIGEGHTIDMSAGGIAFTTQSVLPEHAKVTVYVRWPVRLEENVPVELRAVGRLVRVESKKAAMQVEETTFRSGS
jgi:hypothetical protein